MKFLAKLLSHISLCPAKLSREAWIFWDLKPIWGWEQENSPPSNVDGEGLEGIGPRGFFLAQMEMPLVQAVHSPGPSAWAQGHHSAQ